ncbi:MAG: hypothetical protein Q9191_003815 [Dirinaria sp. TL-2023a]
MYTEKPHPLLAQVPLTVSPFISLPTATTLPYTYKPLPSTLPQSSTADVNGAEREEYVVSASGHVASPESIIASCQALQAHIQRTQEDAENAIKDWETGLKEEELAEKRRVAPGWLDRSEKILEPERKRATDSSSRSGNPTTPTELLDSQDAGNQEKSTRRSPGNAVGDELDRAFGVMNGEFPRVSRVPHGRSYHNASIAYPGPRLAQYSPPFIIQQVPQDPFYQTTGYQLPRSPNIPISPALRNTPAPTAAMAPMGPMRSMVSASPSSRRRQPAPIVVAGAKFLFFQQRFIIYAMSFLGYSAHDVAPVFGLDESKTGNTRISAAQVDAAHEYLKSGREYNGKSGLWERNDKRFKYQVRVKIDMAHGKLCKLRMKQMKDE